MVVIVQWPEDADLPYYENEQEYKSRHVLLRRWDHTDQPSSSDDTDQESSPHAPSFDLKTGTLSIWESDNPDTDHWLTLENGIQISFSKSAGDVHYYQTGDYWLIPARIATGDVEWPQERVGAGNLVPEKRPPHGVEHHYAPLAVITFAGEGEQNVDDCRRNFVSAITPESDLQVHNLDMTGRLALKSISEPLQGSLTFFSETADVEYDGGSDKLFIFKNNGNTTSFQGGKVGVGTTTPRESLAIRAQGVSEGLISFEAPDGTTKWHLTQNLRGTYPGLNFVETGIADGRLFIQAGGNVGIGTLTPGVKLDVNGDFKVHGVAYGSGWTDSSDESLKKNVKSLRGALDSLLQLRGVNFEWKEPENHGNLTGNQIGMIAQDVEKVFPAWVGTSPDGTKNITFRGFEALMVEALRELNSKIDGLIHRMDAIEQQMSALSTDAPSPKTDVQETEEEAGDESESTPKRTGKKSRSKRD
jgi:hypothetical protein